MIILLMKLSENIPNNNLSFDQIFQNNLDTFSALIQVMLLFKKIYKSNYA